MLIGIVWVRISSPGLFRIRSSWRPSIAPPSYARHAHAARSSSSVVVLGFRVRRRNTSSRVGGRRLASSSGTPAASSSRTRQRERERRVPADRADGVAARGRTTARAPVSWSSTAAAFTSTSASGDDDLGVRADERLELGGRPRVRDPAPVHQGDVVGELVGLLQVLGGEQHGRALGGQVAHGVPDPVAAGRVEAGRRLVQEQHLGAADRLAARSRRRRMPPE